MAVHQLIPTFVPGDATGQSALHFQLLLRQLGRFGELYAGEVAPALSSLVKPASALRPAPDDLVLYHHGIASPLSGQLMHLPCRRGLVFHNITPARFYEGSPLHESLVAGRAQLAAMAPHVDLAIGVSDFNAAELREAGYRNVHTVPLFVEPERFAADHADEGMKKRLRASGPTVLSVSRVMPHKRFEDLLSLHEELLRLEPEAQLVIAGGYEPGGAYFKKLRRQAKSLRGVRFLGRVTHAQLVAAYRSASVFVSMSEHEGFGVPLLEAMAAGVPVLAFAAAAVPETLGGRGIAFTEKRFAALAEVVREVCHDAPLRERLLQGQAERLRELSADTAREKLSRALRTVHPEPARAPVRKARRPRVAFVVQRYGEVSGGSELLTRQLAQHLVEHWDITVLTTCAKNHLTWENEFPEGPDRDGRVKVLRFPNTRVRRIHEFNALSDRVLNRPNDRLTEEHWVAEQGPLTPGLLRHLAESASDYDGFVFFTYLYATTAWGLPMVADRALLVSTAHDEAPIRLDLYAEVFERPRGLVCLTPEELAFVDQRFPRHAPAKVASVGIDFPEADPERLRRKHSLS
ncbi:MAG TPA: glycosyltransferase family 4 protein, partial [Myxococcaceae bacterium]|nr:glycosyltransferase family 4 protein [Myxococcaceae bacterium]